MARSRVSISNAEPPIRYTARARQTLCTRRKTNAYESTKDVAMFVSQRRWMHHARNVRRFATLETVLFNQPGSVLQSRGARPPRQPSRSA